MSLLLAMLFPRTCIQEFSSGFCIISFSKLVKVTWEDERAFNQNLELCQFQVISISGNWSLLPSVEVRLFFPIPVLLLSHFSFSILPIQRADILQAFFSPNIPFQNFPILSLGGVSFTII